MFLASSWYSRLDRRYYGLFFAERHKFEPHTLNFTQILVCNNYFDTIVLTVVLKYLFTSL